MKESIRRVLARSGQQQLRRIALAVIAAVALAAPDASAQQGQQARKKSQTFNVVPITINSVTVQNGQLVANGSAGSTPFQAPLTLRPGAVPEGGTCPVLHLSLGPINLSLLGLNVDTSAICLDITAIEGGGLLGDLLCSISTQLLGGTPLNVILGALSGDQLGTLDRGLTSLLNQAVFIPLTSSDALSAATCSILSLSIAPVDLTLLGLNVHLDNCNDGPVTLDITATPGGGLLGDLLCSLTDLLNGSASRTAILSVLRQIAVILGGLLA